MQKRVKENSDLVKSMEGVIINVNGTAKDAAKRAKQMRLKQMKDNESNCKKIECLEQELSEIKSMLTELLQNNNNKSK